MSLNPTVFDQFILLGDFNVNLLFLYSHLMYTLAPFHLIHIINSGIHVHHSGNISLIELVFVSENFTSSFFVSFPSTGKFRSQWDTSGTVC